QQNAITKSVVHVLRFTLDGEAHGGDGVFKMTGILIDLGDFGIDGSVAKSRGKRRLQSSPRFDWLAAGPLRFCQENHSFAISWISGMNGIEFANRLGVKSRTQQGGSKIALVGRLQSFTAGDRGTVAIIV